MVVYVKNTKRLRKGAEIKALAEELEVCSPYIFCKEKASAFSNEGLAKLLRQNHVSEIEIIVIDGNFCVAASAMDAQKSGYTTILQLKEAGVVIIFGI